MRILRALRGGVASLLLVATCWANPTGGDVTAGAAAIQQAGGQMTITQSTEKAIIQWQSFSIGSGESVRFVQPGALSAVLNRVVGVDPSVILGALQANGQVFLLNPNGVVFGPGSQVDVAGLVVSTLNLSDEDFLAGNLNFAQDADKALAAVINQGTIRIKDNGLLVLASPLLSNEGLIVANQGKVALAAGEQTSVSFDPNGLIHFEVADAGETSGKVLLAQNSVSEIMQGVVSNPQLAPATELVQVDGKWELVNGSGVAIQGGRIEVDATTGDAGQVRIDSTQATILTAQSEVSAAGAGANSDGGDIYLLSQGQTVALPGATADISAGTSGDGGFAELSGRTFINGLDVEARVTNGKPGQYLIDPAILFVANGPMPAMPDADTVYEEDLESSAADVLLVADDEVFIEDIADDDITLLSGTSLFISTSNSSGAGVVFEDEFDSFTVTGGSLEIDTAGSIDPAFLFNEGGTITLLVGGDVGTEDEGLGVVADSLVLSVDGLVTLDSEVNSVSGVIGGDLTIEQSGSIDLSVSVGERLSVTAEGSITGDGTAGDNSLLFATDGTIGSEGSPFMASIDGTLLVSATEQVDDRSVTITGSVTGDVQVIDTTPGDSLFNGEEIEELSLLDVGDLLEDFGPEDIVDLADEFGLEDEDIEEIEAQLGLLGEDARFDEDAGFDEDGPDDEGPEPGEPGEGPEGRKGSPIVAQAGFTGGTELKTAALLKVRIEQLPQLQVLVTQPSPFDAALSSPKLRANDILDFSTADLNNFEVQLSYDIMGDPILLNPTLRADDLFELQVGELSEVPIEVR